MSNQRFIIEHGLSGRVHDAINNSNTVEDLSAYLYRGVSPNKGYRLVSCQLVEGNFLLVWEKAHENQG